jgi:DHA1 family bicyclomycin/chloramphenicol resistance-like MFS transporter
VQFAIGAAMIQTVVPIVADQDLALGVQIVGALLGVGGVARLLGAIGAGRIIDRLGRRAALIPGLALQLAGVTTFAFFGSLASLWLSVVLVSLGSVTVNVGTTLLADLSEGGRLGPRLGAFRFTGDAAFLVAPALAGWLLGVQGRMAATLPLVALTGIVLIGCVIWVPETKTAG